MNRKSTCVLGQNKNLKRFHIFVRFLMCVSYVCVCVRVCCTQFLFLLDKKGKIRAEFYFIFVWSQELWTYKQLNKCGVKKTSWLMLSECVDDIMGRFFLGKFKISFFLPESLSSSKMTSWKHNLNFLYLPSLLQILFKAWNFN